MSKLSDSLPIQGESPREFWLESIANTVDELLALPPITWTNRSGFEFTLTRRQDERRKKHLAGFYQLRLGDEVILNRHLCGSEAPMDNDYVTVFTETLDEDEVDTVLEVIAVTGRYFACLALPGSDSASVRRMWEDARYFRPVTEDCSRCPHYLACVRDGHAVNTLEP